jgi:hypothetical protein
LSSSTSSTVNSNFSSSLSKIGIGNDELLTSTQNGEHGNGNDHTGNDHWKEEQTEQNTGEEQHERRKRPNLIDERMIGELAERNQEMDGTVADAANAKKLHLLIARDEPQRLLVSLSQQKCQFYGAMGFCFLGSLNFFRSREKSLRSIKRIPN